MTSRIVKTQAELDTALADGVDYIDIDSPAGVWLEISKSDSSTVTASDSSTVRAYGSSTVTASDSSTVTASDSSTVTAYGSSTVRAYGSSTVRASGSSTVTASGSSTVTASDSSTVRASGSSTVTASGSSTVRAGTHTAVHLHSGQAKVSGGVLIDHIAVNATDAAVWAGYHGVKSTKTKLTVYKAVDADLKSGRGLAYPIGKTLTDPAWEDNNSCGGGLHFGPTPGHALAYHEQATRFLECEVKIADARPITDGGPAKVKARACKVIREVTIDGKPVAS